MLEASTYPEVKGPIVTVGTAPRLQYQRLPGDAPAQISPNAALGVIAAGAVAVIALWWQDTATVHSLGDWLTNAGRITGLLAGYAVVVLLALMARVPALDRGVGTDRLARWHAMGGRYVVSLAVAHTLLIIWGYAVTAHAGLLTQTGSLLTAYPDVLMATVALGLLVGIGVASARAARRRLAYETWHAIHLYTYLAIALAFSHQFSTGADFRFNAGARWAWSVMYVVVAALLLWYRLIAPIRAAQRHQLRVVQVRRENADGRVPRIVDRPAGPRGPGTRGLRQPQRCGQAAQVDQRTRRPRLVGQGSDGARGHLALRAAPGRHPHST